MRAKVFDSAAAVPTAKPNAKLNIRIPAATDRTLMF
jgi:hypothetical protein